MNKNYTVKITLKPIDPIIPIPCSLKACSHNSEYGVYIKTTFKTGESATFAERFCKEHFFQSPFRNLLTKADEHLLRAVNFCFEQINNQQ